MSAFFSSVYSSSGVMISRWGKIIEGNAIVTLEWECATARSTSIIIIRAYRIQIADWAYPLRQ